MGYRLSSLVRLPFDETVEMYVFSIGERLWEGGVGEIVHKNFDQIAKAIGPDAIIVGALKESFHGEVVTTYLGKDYKDAKNLMPALLITDAHPSKLTPNSLRLVVPLREAHKHYEVIDDFFADLAAFVKGDNDQFLRKLEGAPSIAQVMNDIIKVNMPVVPGVVVVNMNAAIAHLREWWARKHSDVSAIQSDQAKAKQQ